MPTKRLRSSGTWEFIIKNKKLLSKPIYLTFASEKEGDEYCRTLESYLKLGLTPPEFKVTHEPITLYLLIRDYLTTVETTREDYKILNTCMTRVGNINSNSISLDWAEKWVHQMKHELNLSPSTIKHYVGALARCLDWANKKKLMTFTVNPLRQLGNKYSFYNSRDKAIIKQNPHTQIKTSEKRNRRFEEGEELKVRKVLNREVINAADRVLDLPYQTALIFLFDMAIETAMRMKEMFTLDVEQVDVNKRTINLHKSKNGDTRQVPMTSTITILFEKYKESLNNDDPTMNGFKSSNGKLFPWVEPDWDINKLALTTTKLSKQFNRIFARAGLNDFHFHDIRHEAVSRLFEKTTMDYVEIAKITGHRDPKMLMTYTHLRGSKLAQKLW